MDLSGLGGSTRGNENDATNRLRDMGISNPSSGLVRWVAYGDQAYGGEEAQRYNLPGWQTKVASDLASRQKAEQAAFFEKQKAEEQGFLGRFRTEFPQILSGIESQLNLPKLREQARTGLQQLEDLPETVANAAFGKDISQTQLERMQGARRAKFLPEVQDLVSNLQFAEEEFGRRSERELVPFQTEIDLMKERLGREATGFTQSMQNELTGFVTALQEGTKLSIANMNRAIELAKLEQEKELAKQKTSAVDLGDKIGFFDATGNLVSSFLKGLAPTRGSKTDSSSSIDTAIADALKKYGTISDQQGGDNTTYSDNFWNNVITGE